MQTAQSADETAGAGTPLVRGIGLGSATALNMIDMIGVGPFITIPLIVTAMGGPQAMVGWILGAVLAICDGLLLPSHNFHAAAAVEFKQWPTLRCGS